MKPLSHSIEQVLKLQKDNGSLLGLSIINLILLEDTKVNQFLLTSKLPATIRNTICLEYLPLSYFYLRNKLKETAWKA